MRTATAMRTAGELGFRRERRFPEALAWELVRGLLIDLYRHSLRRAAFLFFFLYLCAGDCTSTRQFAPVSSLSAVRESYFV